MFLEKILTVLRYIGKMESKLNNIETGIPENKLTLAFTSEDASTIKESFILVLNDVKEIQKISNQILDGAEKQIYQLGEINYSFSPEQLTNLHSFLSQNLMTRLPSTPFVSNPTGRPSEIISELTGMSLLRPNPDMYSAVAKLINILPEGLPYWLETDESLRETVLELIKFYSQNYIGTSTALPLVYSFYHVFSSNTVYMPFLIESIREANCGIALAHQIDNNSISLLLDLNMKLIVELVKPWFGEKNLLLGTDRVINHTILFNREYLNPLVNLSNREIIEALNGQLFPKRLILHSVTEEEIDSCIRFFASDRLSLSDVVAPNWP